MPTSLVRPLNDGPVDVVADVHGEIDALNGLLANRPAKGRHLAT
jgi:hypothetical protein